MDRRARIGLVQYFWKSVCRSQLKGSARILFQIFRLPIFKFVLDLKLEAKMPVKLVTLLKKI